MLVLQYLACSYPGNIWNIEKSYLLKSSCVNLLDLEMRRLRGFCHKKIETCLRQPTPPSRMPTSNHLQVNPYINLYIYFKKLCSIVLTTSDVWEQRLKPGKRTIAETNNHWITAPKVAGHEVTWNSCPNYERFEIATWAEIASNWVHWCFPFKIF